MGRVRLYFQWPQISDQIEILDKEIIHKIKDVLRLKNGDEIFLFDGAGNECSCRIRGLKGKSVELEKAADMIKKAPAPIRLKLAFPLIKEDKIDFILQKATELGVDEFCPFICRHSIQEKPSENKFSRWEKIVIEAARQSERSWLPKIHLAAGFSSMVEAKNDLKLAGVIGGQDMRSLDFPKKGDVLLMIGPEGDWDKEEIILLEKNGFIKVNLSENILRSETAAVFFSGVVKYLAV